MKTMVATLFLKQVEDCWVWDYRHRQNADGKAPDISLPQAIAAELGLPGVTSSEWEIGIWIRHRTLREGMP